MIFPFALLVACGPDTQLAPTDEYQRSDLPYTGVIVPGEYRDSFEDADYARSRVPIQYREPDTRLFGLF